MFAFVFGRFISDEGGIPATRPEIGADMALSGTHRAETENYCTLYQE